MEDRKLWKAAFKAYDIRGRIPDEINPDMTWRVGRAFAEVWASKTVVVGRDVRPSSEALCASLLSGLRAAGGSVIDIGLCGTEMIYFATAHLQVDGGLMVTASHNPQDYNGIKLVQAGARPISGDSGLHRLRDLVCSERSWPDAATPGDYYQLSIMNEYVAHLLQYVDPAQIKPLRVVMDPGNGCAGLALAELMKHFPIEVVPVRFTPDGTFPQGIPNPLLPENRSITTEAIIKSKADVGVAWDGDFDRCFFFDEKGEFLEGYYIVGFLAEAFLKKNPGAKIIHDPRLTWNTREIVERLGGVPIQSKTGHAFIKERMRSEDAVYGGEMSAHHYFRDFYYCDSGMIPFLLMLELLSKSGKRMSELMARRLELYPCSGEINRALSDPETAIRRVEEQYIPGALTVDRTDGVSAEFTDWRFNLRSSNTEPVVRLNVEARGNQGLMAKTTREILEVLEG